MTLTAGNPPRWRDWGIMLVIAGAFFGSVAPTLRWLEFSSGSENLVVATALEIRREDRWFVPHLQGEPRLRKPPLPAWITAAAIRRSTLDAIASHDPQMNRKGYGQLAWDVRWPALVLMAIAAAAVYEMGRLAGGWQLGLLSAMVFATNYAVLRFGRAATPDSHLAFWVIIANVFLMRAMQLGEFWLGMIGGGIAVGLALLTKGPVALAQTIAPAAIVALHRGWKSGWQIAGLKIWRPVIVGLVVMLAIGLPWFAIVAMKYEALSLWWTEVMRAGATSNEPSPWYSYLSLFPMMMPWMLFLMAALPVLAMTAEDKRDPRPANRSSTFGDRPTLMYILLLAAVPLLIMWMFRDREPRYLLPLFGPVSVLGAYGVWVYLKMFKREPPVWRKLGQLQWIMIAVIAVVFPLIGMIKIGPFKMSAADGGGAWFHWKLGMIAAQVGAVIVAGGYLIDRRWRWSLAAATVLAMMLGSTLYAYGYARSEGGRSSMRPLAAQLRREHPDAEVVSYVTDRHTPNDLAIYLNQNVPNLVEAQVASAAKSEERKVLVVLQRRDKEIPNVPAGWRKVDDSFPEEGGKRIWHWYTSEPRP